MRLLHLQRQSGANRRICKRSATGPDGYRGAVAGRTVAGHLHYTWRAATATAEIAPNSALSARPSFDGTVDSTYGQHAPAKSRALVCEPGLVACSVRNAWRLTIGRCHGTPASPPSLPPPCKAGRLLDLAACQAPASPADSGRFGRLTNDAGSFLSALCPTNAITKKWGGLYSNDMQWDAHPPQKTCRHRRGTTGDNVFRPWKTL